MAPLRPCWPPGGRADEPEQVAEVQALHEDLAAKCDEVSAEELSQFNREWHLALLRLGSAFIAEHVVLPFWRTGSCFPAGRNGARSSATRPSSRSTSGWWWRSGDPAEVEDSMAGHLLTAGPHA